MTIQKARERLKDSKKKCPKCGLLVPSYLQESHEDWHKFLEQK